MFKRAPAPGAANAAFGNETVDVWIPFEAAPKGMQDTDKAGGKTLRFIGGVEHSEDNTADGRKKAVQKLPVLQKERTELFCDGEDTVPVGYINELEGHGGSSVNGILTPQEGQKRLWHRKGTNLSVPQEGHPYMAPPKDGSPQWIIFSTFSTTACRG